MYLNVFKYFVCVFQVDRIRPLRGVENPVAIRNEPKLQVAVELALDRIPDQAARSRRNLVQALLLGLLQLLEEPTRLCLVVACLI